MIQKALSFDDVLLLPCYSSVLPHKTDVSTKITRRIGLAIPIISAPMDTVTESGMAIALCKLGGLGVIHKNMSIERQAAEARKVKEAGYKVGAAVSTGDEQFARALLLLKAGVDVLVIDTAHGHSEGVIKQTARIKKDKRFSSIDVIAGNIATAGAAYDLIKAGADAVKVGMGCGSICTTRIITGVGVPQISALREAVKGRARAKKSSIPIIADGGIKYSGDIAKAVAAGASVVMLGGLLAGTDEAPGEVGTIDGKKFKTYRGMGSIAAMQQGSKDRYGQKDVQSKKLVPEGVVGRVPYRGSVVSQIEQLVDGLRSSLGYLGAKNLKEFQKRARFIEITGAGMRESHPHSLSTIEKTVNY